jgi:arylsulfatase A-like enzyme
MVYAFDIFPTLCELLDIDRPETLEGRSLTGVIAGHEAQVRESTFHVYDHIEKPKDTSLRVPPGIQRAVNDGRWKLHQYEVNGKTTVRLFDLRNDPYEIHDLSQDVAAEKEMSRMQTLLMNQRRELNDNQLPG